MIMIHFHMHFKRRFSLVLFPHIEQTFPWLLSSLSAILAAKFTIEYDNIVLEIKIAAEQ
ncbi:hypothetical protein Ngar_c01770 [Candidatus Nitrososphaera gargensis Ga9.2]|uniref:Uncharacterized protein n=1 Tax=Nitrososphaera gargensis (strain Ga9.2) TaxID=1237085 RepID=K0I792_NITGG|nr:hypothetical protein Ngar_c01770 [Candidatus Nitrososphaera gargensis Ga9.2]